MDNPKPVIAIYQGQSLAPPDQKGLTAGSGLWLKMGNQWWRIEVETSLIKVFKLVKKVLKLKKWPQGF